jgi:SagB-type dehydrogenase family enzyme
MTVVFVPVEGQPVGKEGSISLPDPNRQGVKSVEEALAERRSLREYKPGPISLAELGQLLWAAQGITGDGELKTAPSAGALYPLEVYAVVGNVKGLPEGVYRYRPQTHALESVMQADVRSRLAAAALNQAWIEKAPLVIAIAAVYDRTTKKYGDRGVRYVHMEVGHAAENVYLQAGALGLGTVMVGAFDDTRVRKTLNLPKEEQPLCLMPVGRR